MKTCDVCKRNDGHGENSLKEGWIESVEIGTSIRAIAIGFSETWQTSIPGQPEERSPADDGGACELCHECIPKVNEAIGEHLLEKFGLRLSK
jgi:hypothetical protein